MEIFRERAVQGLVDVGYPLMRIFTLILVILFY